MARAADVWRFPCPRCRDGRVLGGDGSGSHPPVGAFAVHDCFTCGLPASDIAATIARRGLSDAREQSDHGEPLARRHYVEELARCEKRFGPAAFPTARCHVALARNYDSFGDARGRDHHRAAWATYATTPEPDHAVWFELFAALGYALKGYAASHAEAFACYSELLRLYERALGATRRALLLRESETFARFTPTLRARARRRAAAPRPRARRRARCCRRVHASHGPLADSGRSGSSALHVQSPLSCKS